MPLKICQAWGILFNSVFFFPYILSLNLPLQMQSLPHEINFILQKIS